MFSVKAGKYSNSPNSINLEPYTVRIRSKDEWGVSKNFNILNHTTLIPYHTTLIMP